MARAKTFLIAGIVAMALSDSDVSGNIALLCPGWLQRFIWPHFDLIEGVFATIGLGLFVLATGLLFDREPEQTER